MSLFSTDGETLAERGLRLPAPLELDEAGKGYVASAPLAAAVEVALLTGMPLLVTGEPGCGKTQLGCAVAYQLGLPLLRFDTKSTSTAQDLLYRFDIVGRFYDAETRRQDLGEGERDPAKPGQYISFGPLGAAIVLAHPERESRLKQDYPNGLKALTLPETLEEPQRCVVLVDEVDKAPRDFANDLLNELENMRFWIAETGETLEAAKALRPIVILTSNAERDLPEPFLRRCAYFHVTPPKLETVVRHRLGELTPLRQKALEHFQTLVAAHDWEKKPSVAELLMWLTLLEKQGITPADFDPVSPTVKRTYSVLLKTQADLERVG